MNISYTVLACCALFALASGSEERQECPPPSIIAPCVCSVEWDRSLSVSCTDEYIPFTQVFSALEAYLEAVGQSLSWGKINVIGTMNTEIPANAFGNITANWLNIYDNNYLSSVHPEVFSKMSNTLRDLRIQNNTLLEDVNELFEGLNSAIALNRLTIFDCSYDHIPAGAFKAHPDLMYIYFRFQPLKSIGAQAFYELNSLKQLDISSEPNLVMSGPTITITAIHPQAFEFKSTSSDSLSIELSGMKTGLMSAQLNPLNFGSFNGREVSLKLYNQAGIVYLNQTAFTPFFNDNDGSTILVDFLGECSDCRSAWLLNKNLIETRVVTPDYTYEKVRCLSSSGLQEYLADQTFDHCKDPCN